MGKWEQLLIAGRLEDGQRCAFPLVGLCGSLWLIGVIWKSLQVDVKAGRSNTE
jgi:hypothetical protein